MIGALLMAAVCMTAAVPVMAEPEPDLLPAEEEIIWEEEAAPAVMEESVEADVEEPEAEEPVAEEPAAEEPKIEEPEAEESAAEEPAAEETVTEEPAAEEPEAEEPEAEEPEAEEVNLEEDLETVPADVPSVEYCTHVQTYGWQEYVKDGQMSGTSGESKRLEGIKIKISGAEDLGIEYRTHVQTYGWQKYVSNDSLAGTTGESKRLEAIQIRLTGNAAGNYDVYYRVHCQTFGWLGWAKNGEPSGSAGYSKRLEAIEIELVPKGGSAPGSTQDAFISSEGQSEAPSGKPLVRYCTHVQTYGWQRYVTDGQMSGTSGESKRLEGIRIRLANQKYSGDIEYRTHVQTYGWQKFVKNGTMSGTQGESKRLEAIEIRLTGDMAEYYDVYYRVHCQTFGWMGWARSGQPAGTAGYGKRLEGIEIRLVTKGSPAPGSTENAFREYSEPEPDDTEELIADTTQDETPDTIPDTIPDAVDTTVMSEANWQVLVNVIGAVESGGQIYGNRNYGAYAGRYAASPYEHTCTLGWAQFYGGKAQDLVQNIFNANSLVFRSIDAEGVIEDKLAGNWESERWDPSEDEKSILIRLITSDVGKKQQDLMFRNDAAPLVAYCESTYTSGAKAVIMYTEIAHLGGQAAANRIFSRCSGNYSTGAILASLKLDQNDYSNNQQVGDSIYNLRHAKCAEFVEKYVQ